MNAWFRRFGALAAALWCGFVTAAPGFVETFDAHTWPALRGSLKAPAAVVFTTTDCVYCPGVIRQLADEIRKRRSDATLVAVVMDVGPGDADAQLLRDPHYQPADRLLAFSGPAAALRYVVDPKWRGVTPFVALLRPGEAPSLVAGQPSAQAMASWMRPATR